MEIIKQIKKQLEELDKEVKRQKRIEQIIKNKITNEKR